MIKKIIATIVAFVFGAIAIAGLIPALKSLFEPIVAIFLMPDSTETWASASYQIGVVLVQLALSAAFFFPCYLALRILFKRSNVPTHSLDADTTKTQMNQSEIEKKHD